MAADTEEPLYSSRSIKIFAKDYDSLHTTWMNRQGDSGEHGSKLLSWDPTLWYEETAYEHDFKIWGPRVADEFTQCMR
jgi:hypothetical protein